MLVVGSGGFEELELLERPWEGKKMTAVLEEVWTELVVMSM